MEATVHLEGIRCDGEAYGGCGAACLIFWKEAWLKPIPGRTGQARPPLRRRRHGQGSTEDDVWAGTRAAGSTEDDPTYRCQATALPAATAPLPWWDVRQYVEDYTSGNVGLRELAGGLGVRAVLHAPTDRSPVARPASAGSPVRPVPIASRRCPVPAEGGPGGRRPAHSQPSSWISYQEHPSVCGRTQRSSTTLDGRNRNRGLFFDAEEVPYCGQSHRCGAGSSAPSMSGPASSSRSAATRSCSRTRGAWGTTATAECSVPRAIYPFWRETWLEREECSVAAVELESTSR